MPDALENPIVLILIGAAISLVASVAVTGLQARLLRRNDVREASRASARRLTSVFIGERDSADSADGFLTEAEITVMSMTDRKTRERLAAVLRLLRADLVEGEPRALEHLSLRWLAAADLDGLDWLPADVPFLGTIGDLLAPRDTPRGEPPSAAG